MAQYILKVLLFRIRVTLQGIKIRSTKGNVKQYQGSSCKGIKLDGIKGALYHDRVCLAMNSVQFAFTTSGPMRCSPLD